MAKDINMELGIESDTDESSDEQNKSAEREEIDKHEGECSERDADENEVPELVEGIDDDEIRCRLDSVNLSDCSNEHYETQSVRSTTTTIHPDEIKKRIQKEAHKKETRQTRKRCVAKGEASALTRNRRENLHTIKHSGGIWGWE